MELKELSQNEKKARFKSWIYNIYYVAVDTFNSESLPDNAFEEAKIIRHVCGCVPSHCVEDINEPAANLYQIMKNMFSILPLSTSSSLPLSFIFDFSM